MKNTTYKRLLSLALVLAMLLSCLPSVLLWEAKAATNDAPTGIVETKSDRITIYLSASGSESNSGMSESQPKKDVTKIPTYLAKGYNVKLKRGDIWYLPTNPVSTEGHLLF